MSVLSVTCDICDDGKEIEGGWFEDYDDRHFCKKHWLEKQICDLTQQRDNKQKWLEETHLKGVWDMTAEIEKLQTELEALNG